MPIVNTQLFFDNLNVSVQVGDTVFFTPNTGSLGGFNSGDINVTNLLGLIISITGNSIIVAVDTAIVTNFPANPIVGDYISFVKDKRVNTSSLLGYYASVNFVNDSRGKVELFSVGSNVSESSK